MVPRLGVPQTRRVTPERPRPSLHLTAARGWTNDPHGIVHDGDAYHLFFQHVPDATTWAAHCHWGHATSTDLVRWVEQDVALAPEPPEVGCWSGSAVVEAGRPVLLYTRIVDAADTDRAAVVLARPDGAGGWRRRTVIGGPPEGVDVVAFRDPQVRVDGDRWRAVLGGGLVGVGGCALQYSSADLEEWTFEGVLASRPDLADTDGGSCVRTGSVWECPQLVRVGDRDVPLVSAWWDGEPRHVVYAVGDYAEGRFTASRWGRFSYGDSAYATTTFTDVDGRVCAMSWLRERPDHDPAGSPWASAMSLVHVLTLDGDRLLAGPHPALDAALPAVRDVRVPGGGVVEVADPGPVWRLRLDGCDVGPQGGVEVVVGEGAAGWRLRLDAGRLSLATAAETLLDVPVLGSRDAVGVDLVVDADIVEVTVSAVEGVGAARLPYAVTGPLLLRARDATVAAARLHTPAP